MINLRKFLPAAASTVVALASAAALAQPPETANPYSPRFEHPYRHGVVPTRETARQMSAWASVQPDAASSSLVLAYAGGVDNIGVTSGKPKVYLVVYGSQWGTKGTDAQGNMTLSNDIVGAVPYLQMLFKGLGTGAELWSGVLTEYCDGKVAVGSTSCPSTAAHIGYPTGGALAGIWYDNGAASPTQASGKQLAQVAVAAAAHFGNTTAASNRYAQYVILSPSGAQPDGFNTPGGGFCAWHSYNGDTSLSGGGAVASAYGDISFTNMPYVYDAGYSCWMDSVNSGNRGALDGVSIVEGHEYGETLTDPTFGGWYNQTSSTTFGGYEIGDECNNVYPDPGFVQNVVMGNGSYAMQSMWSNSLGACVMAHPIVGASVSDTIFGNGFQ